MARQAPQDPLIVILGATGTGKSQLAVDLAVRYNGEIINGDTVQMYEGFPIITNKIPVAEQKGIPHHLLGFINLRDESWRVGQFKTRATQIIQEIRSRGRLPILVGGTHYYTQSLLFPESLITGQATAPDEPPPLSPKETSERFPILEESTEVMLAELRKVDPVMAERWHPKDTRKIRRSLEIYLTAGKKASDIYSKQKERKVKSNTIFEGKSLESRFEVGSPLFFWVYSDHETLKQRLDTRVDKMVEGGLLDEIKTMQAIHCNRTQVGEEVDLTRGIWISIGWKEFEPYLSALKTDAEMSTTRLAQLLSDSIEHMKGATRQYAKRQVRWIRHKLMIALVESNAFDKLYLLDGSDVSKWSQNVLTPALDITQSFLSGQQPPVPASLSDTAKEILNLDGDHGSEGREKAITRYECKICEIVVIGDSQWQMHVQGRNHRRMTKKKSDEQANGTSSMLTSEADLSSPAIP